MVYAQLQLLTKVFKQGIPKGMFIGKLPFAPKDATRHSWKKIHSSISIWILTRKIKSYLLCTSLLGLQSQNIISDTHI